MKPKKQYEQGDESDEPSNKWLYIGIVAIIVLFFCVAIVISKLQTPDGFSKVGTLGDAFNGLLAPFISLLSAILVYYSFREQIIANKRQYKANELIQSQWLFDTHLRLFTDIKDSFDNLQLRLNPVGKTMFHGRPEIRGQEVLMVIVQTDWMYIETVPEALGAFQVLTAELNFLLKKLETTRIKNKDYLLHKIYLFIDEYYSPISGELLQLFDGMEQHGYHKLVATLTELDIRYEKLVEFFKEE